jgi:hypothetical protein
MTALRADAPPSGIINRRQRSLGGALDVEPAVTRPLNLTGIDGVPFADICGRVENDPIAALDAIADLDRRAAIANHGELSDVDGAVLDGSDPQAVRTEPEWLRTGLPKIGLPGIWSSTSQYVPGVSRPSGLGTSISVCKVRVPGTSALATRATTPRNSTPGSFGARTTAPTPGPKPNA